MLSFQPPVTITRANPALQRSTLNGNNDNDEQKDIDKQKDNDDDKEKDSVPPPLELARCVGISVSLPRGLLPRGRPSPPTRLHTS